MQRVEGLIGSVRRECSDHLIIWDASHPPRIVRNYLAYDHGYRTHPSLNKDASEGRVPESAEPGIIGALPVVGGLYHHYTGRGT